LSHAELAQTIAESERLLLRATEDQNQDVREYAIEVLSTNKAVSDDKLEKAVVRGLADPSKKVRRVALGAVSYRKFNRPGFIAALLGMASSQSDLPQVIEALGNVAPTDHRAVEVFVAGLHTESTAAKTEALLALTKAGSAGMVALPTLQELAASSRESEQIRKLAEDAIKKVQSSPSNH
jgi:HEAT repeat protein